MCLQKKFLCIHLLDSYGLHDVCLLKSALYGFKQAPQAWFDCFNTCVLCQRLETSAHDSALFSLYSDADCMFLLLYTDDMIINGSDIGGIQNLKRFLHQQFEMKDPDHLIYFSR